jgi:hypothetical protein
MAKKKTKIKKYKIRRASFRQQRALTNLVEKGGSARRNIKAAGYSDKVADNPGRLFSSKSFQELAAERLSDDLLTKVHLKLLKHRNFRANIPAVDMAYKVRGKYAPDQVEIIKRKYQDLSNAELVALEKKFKEHLLRK